MPELQEQLTQIDTMLKEVNGKLETVGEDGKPIKLLDVFKMFPELQVKYAYLEKQLQAIETKMAPRKWADMPGVNEGKEKFSMFKVFRAINSHDWKGAEFEKEVMDQARIKAGSAYDDVAGGYLVPAQAIPELIEYLRAETVALKLGARLIDNLQGSPVLFPRQTGGATVYWVADNTAPTAGDLAFGQLQLTPKKAMAIVQLSNSLLRMSLPSAEQVVRQDVALQMALAVDYACLRGSGTSNQPLGIANTPGINTANVGLGTDGLAIANLDVFDDMEYTLQLANALRGKPGYAFHPAIRRMLKKIKIKYYSGDNGVRPLIEDATDKGIESALGYPFAMTTQIPINLTKGAKTACCTEIYFGNWAELLIGQWAGIRIDASGQAGTSWAADQTWIRIIVEMDTALRHPASFTLCNDASLT